MRFSSIYSRFSLVPKYLSSVIILLVYVQLSYSSQDITDASASSQQPGDGVEEKDENVHVGIDLAVQLKKPPSGFSDDLETDEHRLRDHAEKELTFEKLYEQGVSAYDNQLWYSCVSKIEKAITDYRNYKHVLSDCRLGCSKGVKTTKFANLSSNVHDFSTFAKFLKDADCFTRCTDELVNTHPRLTERLEYAFEKRIPYQYLQFCYFKLDRLKLAASAAYTHFLANPNDLDTKQNIVYYRDKALVSDTDFVDLELVPYKEHYIRAMIAYSEHEWGSVVFHLEASLEEYFKEHERCLSDCEASVKMTGVKYSTGVADLIINILTCKLNCEVKLSTVYTEPINLFLQDMYHYLQFSYYKEGDLEKSAEATASFLVLNSSFAIMNENKDILKSKLNYADDDFIPRKDVAEYAVVRKELQDLMDVINKDYRWPDTNENVLDEDLRSMLDRTDHDVKLTDDWMSRYEKLGMHVIAKSADLHREERFVTDGLLKEEQCEELLTLTKDLKTEPIGSQKFDLKVAKERLEESPNEDYEASLRLFVRAAEVVRHYTQRYLNLEESLYLKYTSLVCWSESHDLHCYTQEDGTCIRFDAMSDELYSDAFTTVTYLNTADEDGDFQFLNENDEVDISFGVKCGRTIGFNTGDRHAMKVPNQGDPRCAMVVRYTTYRSSDEKDYHDTLVLLDRVNELRLASAAQTSQDVMKRYEEMGVKIVKNSEELMGKERFLADGLASDSQCSTLINLVQNGALLGDGYDHLTSKPSFISPHTEHELYQGITIYRASKLAQQKRISTSSLRFFLELSESSRLLVEKYLNLSKPLYFDYTHLVCRTAIVDDTKEREDLSHPVHSDNCLLQPDSSCIKDYPAFTQRDYSALLYLNDDFEGGDLFFAYPNKTEQISVRPKCGRLLGFNAGEFHGVQAVKRGQRCALALWFTHNPNFKELAHIQARKVLTQIEDETKLEVKPAHEDL